MQYSIVTRTPLYTGDEIHESCWDTKKSLTEQNDCVFKCVLKATLN